MPVCSFQGRNRGRKKNVKDNGAMALTPSERRMISKMREIKFGSVEIKIQDGKAVEVEYREKERLG